MYLGSFDTEEQAALAWDLAAVKLHGHTAATNFPISNYEQELEHQDSVTKEELVLQLRRQGKGMRGPSTPTPSTPTPGYTYKKGRRKYKGVSELKHRHGVWEAFIHQVQNRISGLCMRTTSTAEGSLGAVCRGVSSPCAMLCWA